MPFISISESPMLPGVAPLDVYYREAGSGTPLVFLHGGWGYETYPFDRQIEAFGDRFRIIIPDRSGYGRSARVEEFPTSFHRRAAVETRRTLDALGINRPVLWGHSDGAVIAAMMGISSPDSFSGLILEAFHFYRMKPRSRAFFEMMVSEPQRLGRRVYARLAHEHGESYWRKLIANNGSAWLKLAYESIHPKEDLYGGTLSRLTVPTLFIHGSRDPRTELDELEGVRQQLPEARMRVIEGAGHSPHSEIKHLDECIGLASEFLRDALLQSR